MITVYISFPSLQTFQIKSKSEAFIEALHLMFGAYCKTATVLESYSYIFVEKLNENEYFVSYNEHKIITDSPISYIYHYMIQDLMLQNNVWALHGAAVCYKNEVYLLLAPTHIGKTTLTAYLTNSGLEYVTDDCIVIDRASLMVHPFSIPLHLRSGGMEVLKKVGCNIPDNLPSVTEGNIHRYVLTPDKIRTSPVKIAKIFFIERTEDINSIDLMDGAQSVMSLLNAPSVNYPIISEYLQFVSEIAKIGCYNLKYSDMNFVLRSIRDE